MYSTPRCSWCDRVAKMLEEYDVNVEKVLTEMKVNTLDKKKILKEIQPKKKKKAEEEIANTTAGVAMIPTHMKFKAFVRRKSKEEKNENFYSTS